MLNSTGVEKWFQVVLRFQGDALVLEEIEEKLGIIPSFVGRIGEHVGDNSRRALYQTNIWVRTFTQDASETFETQIERLLGLLEEKKDELAQILQPEGIEGELFLGFSSSSGQGGAYFPHQLLSRVGALELDLNLDLYPSGEPKKD